MISHRCREVYQNSVPYPIQGPIGSKKNLKLDSWRQLALRSAPPFAAAATISATISHLRCRGVRLSFSFYLDQLYHLQQQLALTLAFYPILPYTGV